MTYFVNIVGTLLGAFLGYCLTVLACATALLLMESSRDVTHQQCFETALAIGPLGALIGAILGLIITYHVTSMNSGFGLSDPS